MIRIHSEVASLSLTPAANAIWDSLRVTNSFLVLIQNRLTFNALYFNRSGRAHITLTSQFQVNISEV
jgi:hypothetical protein